MQILLKKILNRKEFLKTFIRYGTLTVFVLATGFLVTRSSTRNDRSLCSVSQTCRSCRQLKSCSYPEAEKMRKKIKDKTDMQATKEILKDEK
jgi:hypothetical protein